MQERWSIDEHSEGLDQTVFPRGAAEWTLKPGQATHFVSGTDGYTLQLEHAGHGCPLAFSVTLYKGDGVAFGPFTTTLPTLQELPHRDQNVLSLRTGYEPFPKESYNLPEQKLQSVTFSSK